MLKRFLITSVTLLAVHFGGLAHCFLQESNEYANDISTIVGLDANVENNFQLYERALGVRNEVSLNPTVDPSKALEYIDTLSEETKKQINSNLTELVRNYGDSLVSQLLSFIRHFLRPADPPKNFAGERRPNLFSFTKEVSPEALLIDVEKLPSDDITKSQPVLDKLVNQYKGTELGIIFASLSEMLSMQSNLQKYARWGENVDKEFGLDKPLDFLSLGLPVPTAEKPVVYFELKDENHPEAKCLVQVKIEGDTMKLFLLVLPKGDVNGGENKDLYDFTAPNDPTGVAQLYKNLPISKVIRLTGNRVQ